MLWNVRLTAGGVAKYCAFRIACPAWITITRRWISGRVVAGWVWGLVEQALGMEEAVVWETVEQASEEEWVGLAMGREEAVAGEKVEKALVVVGVGAGEEGCGTVGSRHATLVSGNAPAPIPSTWCLQASQNLTLAAEASVVGAGWGSRGGQLVAGVVGCTTSKWLHTRGTRQRPCTSSCSESLMPPSQTETHFGDGGIGGGGRMGLGGGPDGGGSGGLHSKWLHTRGARQRPALPPVPRA